MPTGDVKLGQLATLRNKLIELDALLKEERKVTTRLRDQSEKKSEQLAIVEAEITAEAERFRWKKEEILFSMRNNRRDTAGRVELMKAEEKKMLLELAESDLVQQYNERLHARLKEVSSEHMQISSANFQERENRKQKDFDVRMEMEEMLRKMIKNVDESYQQEAVAKMQREASQANIENERIHTEFSIREAKTEALIRQQQISYEQLMRTKIERDVMSISTEMQEKNIQKLTKQNMVFDMQVKELGRQVQRLRHEVASLSSAVFNKLDLDNQCKRTLDLIHQQESDAQAWRHITLKLCKKLLRECHAIAEKARIRGNAKVTQRLDELTSSAALPDAAQSHELLSTQHLLDQIAEGPFSPREEDREMDFEAIWRVPANPMDDYRLVHTHVQPTPHPLGDKMPMYYSTGKLAALKEVRHGVGQRESSTAIGLSKKHSAPAILASSAKMYKSFSM